MVSYDRARQRTKIDLPGRPRPALAAVMAAVEQVKGRTWAEYRNEYMALYLGRRLCGMKLAELAEAAGLRNYGVVAANAKR